VLFLIDTISTLGGAERVALGMATHLPRDRFDVWLCTTRVADRPAVELLAAAGVTHVNLGRVSSWDVHRFARLVALIRRERFDVIHAHLFGSNLWGTLIGRACRVPVVLAQEHTWSYEGEPVRKWLDGHVIGRLATRFIAVSSLDAERMVSVEGVRPEKVVMLPNAYLPRPRSVGGNLRAELGIGASTPLIVSVAVLRPQKALSVLLEALTRVLREFPDARLAIAGPGPCKAELEATSARLGLQEPVRFLGPRRDADMILETADVVAMSSDYEGTPMVAFECMASRTPLVATAVGGLPDIVEDGRTGLLVPRRDPRRLADAIIRLLRDPVLREQMGTAAEARLPEFTIESSVQRLIHLYETLIAENVGVPERTR
jgi:glycosyltransferase involved in cell wall biosynthesis